MVREGKFSGLSAVMGPATSLSPQMQLPRVRPALTQYCEALGQADREGYLDKTHLYYLLWGL